MNDVTRENSAAVRDALQVLDRLIRNPAIIEARIVGGAARDYALDRPIRDFDMMVRFDSAVDVDDRQDIIRSAFGDQAIDVAVGETLYGPDEELFMRVETETYTYEFIELGPQETIDSAIGRFPDSISKVSIAYNGAVIPSVHFLASARSQIINIKPGFTARAAKLRAKYPEYELITV